MGMRNVNELQQKQLAEQQAKAKQDQQAQLWQQSGGNPQAFLAAGGDVNFAKTLIEGQNLGRTTVARTVETVDARGRPVTQQLDSNGNPVGAPIPRYVAPSRSTSTTTPTAPTSTTAPPPKPLPSFAARAVNEARDMIGTASAINADLGAVQTQIANGTLSFGPVSNLINQGRNMAGISSEESRNFSSFKSNLERLRNESLRLNTGVQTDGDAQRAWNELFSNLTDTNLVNQRLAEIRRINERGVQLQQIKANETLRQFGHPDIDVTPYQNLSPSINSGAQTPGAGNAARPGPTPQNAPQPNSRIRFDAQGNIIQ
jgi:hypothetical protein